MSFAIKDVKCGYQKNNESMFLQWVQVKVYIVNVSFGVSGARKNRVAEHIPRRLIYGQRGSPIESVIVGTQLPSSGVVCESIQIYWSGITLLR